MLLLCVVGVCCWCVLLLCVVVVVVCCVLCVVCCVLCVVCCCVLVLVWLLLCCCVVVGLAFRTTRLAGPPKISLFFPLTHNFNSSWGGIGGSGAAGVPHDSPRTANVHASVPGLQTPPKFHEETPKRSNKEVKLWREREKTRNFRPPTLWGPLSLYTRSKNGLAQIGFGPNWRGQNLPASHVFCFGFPVQ